VSDAAIDQSIAELRPPAQVRAHLQLLHISPKRTATGIFGDSSRHDELPFPAEILQFIETDTVPNARLSSQKMADGANEKSTSVIEFAHFGMNFQI
jgi:hypothetical protein